MKDHTGVILIVPISESAIHDGINRNYAVIPATQAGESALIIAQRILYGLFKSLFSCYMRLNNLSFAMSQ